MKRSARISVIAIFMITLIASSCKGNASAPVNEGNTTALPSASDAIAADKPAPLTLADLTVKATLEDRPAVTATIGPEGGTLSTVDANGTQYTLVIPEGALLFDVDISMTPLASAEGEVLGDTFLAGVRLEPDGLQFIELVSLEITGAVIEEGAVGFTAQSDGQSFHLIPSTSEQGTLTLTTTHFSDPGAAKNELAENLEGLEGLADSIADLENQLAKMKDSNEIIAFLKYKAEELQRQSAGAVGLENWWDWTNVSMNLIGRFNEAFGKHKWDLNTPGLKDLITQMSLLGDDWYIATDAVVPVIAQKCEQGEIIYERLGSMVLYYSETWDVLFPAKDDFRREKMESWNKALASCFNWVVDWQANVETKGTAQPFDNFINLGAEIEFNINNINRLSLTPEQQRTNLKVLYIQGFFQDLCVPKDGTISLGLSVRTRSPGKLKFKHNELDTTNMSAKIHVYAKIEKQVFIDCSQGTSSSAEAQNPFHGGALEKLNEDRVEDGFWKYELIYDPGGGVAAQFQEGSFESGKDAAPIKIEWEEGTQELSQLITLYVHAPTD